MNNLTKIAALPTGGGCQSALRPEDRGAERKLAPELQPWQAGMLRALIGKSLNREFIRDVLGGQSGFAIGGLVGSSHDRMLLDTAPIRYGCDLAGEVDPREQKLGGITKVWEDDKLVWEKAEPAVKGGYVPPTLVMHTASGMVGDQVEAVSIEPGEGPCLGVWPTLTVNFGGPPSDIDAEQFRRGLARLRAAADRAFWPERCRADLKGGGA